MLVPATGGTEKSGNGLGFLHVFGSKGAVARGRRIILSCGLRRVPVIRPMRCSSAKPAGWTASNFKDGCYEFTTDGKIWQKVRGSRSFKQQLYFVVPGRMVRSWSASAPQRVADEQLYSKAEEAWQASWERFYDERTHLFYDHVCSYEPKNRLATLPTPEEIGRQFPTRTVGEREWKTARSAGEPCSR